MTKVLFKRKTSDEIANLPVEDGALIYNHETGATYLDYGNERIPTGGGMPTGDTFPIGAITSYAGDTAPVNWLICDGRAISRTTYADLFDAIGTTYGVGDGSTTFNLPNLKGRVITGIDSNDTAFDTLGETGGEKTHTLTVDEMPSHKHELHGALTGETKIVTNTGNEWAQTTTSFGSNEYIENTGGGQPHNILQPYITLNYIIKAFQSSGTVANVSTTTTNSDTDTYSCNYINSMDKYSTNEVKTNKVWIDGKPIYRKVISIPQFSNTEVYVNTGITTISDVVSIDGSFSRVGYTKRYSIDNTYMNEYNIELTTGVITILTNNEYVTFQGYMILEYTKTVDA